MKIMDFLNKKAVTANLKSTDKEGVIRELVDLLARAEDIKNREELIKTLTRNPRTSRASWPRSAFRRRASTSTHSTVNRSTYYFF
jgi:DNA primase